MWREFFYSIFLALSSFFNMIWNIRLKNLCAKTRSKTIMKNMADYMDEILASLLQLPTELEVMRQYVHFTSDLNSLEYWYRR